MITPREMICALMAALLFAPGIYAQAPEKSEAPMRSEPYRKVTPSRQVAAPRSSGSSGSAPGDYPRRGSKNKSQKTKYNKFKSSGGGGGNSGGHRSSGD